MSRQVIIIGCGGQGAVVADIVVASGDIVLGFLDDAPKNNTHYCGFPILGSISEYKKFDAEFIVAIGHTQTRKNIVALMSNVHWYTAIHPSAVISQMNTRIGSGSIIMAHSVINPRATIASHCIINTASVVEHDCVIEDFTHISVGAKLAGTVHIGNSCWIGIGAVISNNLTVCSNCIIGAGAVVVRNINEVGTYIGVPARRIK